MSSNGSRRNRLAASLLALGGAAAVAASLAAPAGAAKGQGEAVLIAADHSKGRTLSGQGVKLIAAAGAAEQGGKLNLPITALDPTAQPSATSPASLTFKRGKKALTLTDIRFDLTAGTIRGTLAGVETPVFWLGAPPAIDSAAGRISLSAGKLRLTAESATALQERLGLPRALVRKNVGMIWLAAQASPAHAAAQPVISGSAGWGVLASWRKYVLGSFGPGSVGTITTEGGASATGDLAEASSFFGFPATSGSFEKGLYGASDKLTLSTQGSVRFAKPGHCITEVSLAGIELRIGGAGSSLTLDAGYDVEKVEGKACGDQPAVPATRVTFATLDLSGIAPSYSPDGKAVAWTAVPASLTAAGSAAFVGGKYPAGQALDPITISVGLG
jgi:Htaa